MRTLLISLFLCSVANAVDFCLPAFLGLSESETRPLAKETYGRLFLALGKDLKPEELDSIAQGGDPFTLPEGFRDRTESLGKRLKELRDMLAAQGWDTPGMRTELLERLHQQDNEKRGLLQKQRVAVELAANAFLRAFPT